jgi:hypothetical protein
MAGGTGRIGFLWTIRACWIPDGAGQQNVPLAQSLAANNDFGANSGLIIAPGGNAPTGGNIDTAIAAIATAAQAYFDTGTPLATIQGWANGTG